MRIEARDGRGFGGFGARGLAAEVSFGFDLREGENGTACGLPNAGEGVDPGTAGIAEAEELGDFVEGFAGGVVNGAADEGVMPRAVGGVREIEMRVAAGDDEGEGCASARRTVLIDPSPNRVTGVSLDALRLCRGFALVEQDRVDVAFEMIDGDEWEVVGEGESLGVGDADEKRSGEAGAGGDGDGVEIGEREAGFGERGADDGNNGAKMLAAGELGNDAAVAGVGGDLRGDDGGERARSALDDGRGGFVAGGFDAEDEAAGIDSV